MNYKETLKYMFDHLPMFQRDGKSAFKKDLDNILALCKELKNPEKDLKFIHIAGTNGKGSVSHLMAAMLQSHGYKTGLYTSPHYKDFRERIKINGEYISKKYVVQFVEQNMEIFERIQPSFFEMSFAMALDYFREEKVDFAVIETGLGGRLDSTNVVLPEISVITNISWDHTDILGDTLEKIATEKAGIIKEGIPVLVGRHQSETKDVFINTAELRQSKLTYADQVPEIESFFTKEGQFQFEVSLLGPYQIENIKTALAAFYLFAKRKNFIPEIPKLKEALQNTQSITKMMGRWQFLKGDFDLLIDSAHNEDGLRFFTEWLRVQNYSKVHIVCGFVKDKSLDKILQMFPKHAEYYFTQASIPRALDAHQLKEQAASFSLKGKSYKKVRNAFKAAKKAAKSSELVVVIGSIFVVGEVI